MDEEGTRFDAALFGSRAFVGEDVSGLGDRVDADGDHAARGDGAAGYDLDRVGEAHRVDEVAPTSSCTSSRGRCSRPRASRSASSPRSSACAATACGCAARRTTPARRRCGCGATRSPARRGSRSSCASRARARDDITANVGKITVAPGGANVVPGLADFTIDVRAATPEGMAELERLVEETVTRIAREEGLEAELEPTFALEPLELDPGARRRRRARRRGRGRERAAHAERRGPRRDGGRPPRARRDDLRPEPRRHQPFARGVQLARRTSSWECASWQRPFDSPWDGVGDHARSRSRHRWHVHGLHALRHGVRRRSTSTRFPRRRRSRSARWSTASPSSARPPASRPADVTGVFHGTTDRDERRARARGRRGRDDHDPRLPRHRPHRPPPAAAALLGDAGHPVAGARRSCSAATARS